MVRKILGLFALSGLLVFGFSSCDSSGESSDAAIQYETRYDSLNAVIKDDPNNAALYAMRAEWRKDDEDQASAYSDLDRAMELDSLNDQYYLRKAEWLIEEKQFGKAKALLDDAIYKVPSSTGIMLKISEIYMWAGEYQKCINWANAALGFDAYNGQAYYLKGMAHKYSKDTVKAVSSFQTAVEQNPDHYEAYIQLGMLYAIENHPLAEAYFSNAIKVKPESVEALYAKGLFLQENEEAKKALDQYRRILELSPDHVSAWYNMGYVKLILEEELDSAQYFFEESLKRAPDYADAHYNLGYTMELKGEKEEALKKYREVLEMNPSHTLAAKGVNRLTGQ
ncbi:tetratricopeptide repeat protein [bacterium SCSIO 12741]|nr:tetratricopeptide repeat protein [bacterium SCSIO 12741]